MNNLLTGYPFSFMVVGGVTAWALIQHQIQKYLVSDQVRGYLLSTGHALLTVVNHGYLVYYPVYAQSPTSLIYYNWIYAMSISYFLLDLIHLVRFCRQKGYFYSMIFHHLLGITSISLAYITANFTDDNFNWEISLAFLSELSTPLLNYIQYHRGQLNMWWKVMFVSLFFCCRPIIFTYLLQVSVLHYGWQDPRTICCIAFTGLNYYWFYRIVQKFHQSKKEQ